MIQDFSIGAKLIYKLSFEKLTDRLALASDVGAFCESLPQTSDTTHSEVQVAGESANTALPAVTFDSPAGGNTENDSAVPYVMDPDGNGTLNEDDVLFMLFVLKDNGFGEYKPLFDLPPDREFVSGADFMEGQHAMRWNACNVNQDLYFSPLDLLLVINELNSQNNNKTKPSSR